MIERTHLRAASTPTWQGGALTVTVPASRLLDIMVARIARAAYSISEDHPARIAYEKALREMAQARPTAKVVPLNKRKKVAALGSSLPGSRS